MAINLFDRARSAWNALRSNPANPQRGSHFFFGRNHAGVHVTHETAFMSAAVWACIDVVASSLASSDWNVYQGIRGATTKEATPEDNLQYILNTRFNPEMTAQAGKRAMAIAAVGYGNGYAEIERDMSRRIVALWPISPDRGEVVRNESGRLVLRVTQDYQGGTVDVDMEDVFHVRGASLIGTVGDDMIGKAIETIGRAVAIDQFASAYFGNNAQLGTIFQFNGTLTEEKYEQAKKRITERYVGPKRSHTPGLFEGDWKIHQLSNDADKAQLIEAKNQIVEEVCRWFRVPPHKVAHLLRSTNNNIEHQGLEFSRDTLRPWVKEIEQESDYKLFPARGVRRFVEIDTDWASEGDFQSRMQGFSTGITGGIYSVNDVRRKLGENTIGATGDVHMVQGAMMKLDDVGKNMMPAQQGAGSSDSVAQAWLASVYARIERRRDNRAANLQKAGHKDWLDQSRKDAIEYAEGQLMELQDMLGERLYSAQRRTVAVLDGLSPAHAAIEVFEKGPDE